VRLIPGATSLFSRLTEAGIRIGIVTSSHTAFVERKLSPLKEAGIDGMIHTVVALEDTMQQKPSPEPVMACLKRLEVSGKRSVYVGDADVDIMAGRRAGTRTIGVLTGVDDYETLARHLPDLIVDGIEDLVRLF
jgi:HAD superfamily hydrolase (TIGR01662 family)